MRYFSTDRNSPAVRFREAVELGQPPAGGLFFPIEIPRLPAKFLERARDRSNTEIAFEIIKPYVAREIPDEELFKICDETLDFPFPVVTIQPRIAALELFHGPTLAFKDVGARFMSRCLSYFSRDRSKNTIVIVATSGDTGGAVAAGFEGLDGIEVVILYPKGRVSSFQERQLTMPRRNVTTLEVRGSFDDCQALAKRALADRDLRGSAFITSANSINIARWLPQQFYYAFALKEWDGDPPVVSVPSGNFGNIAAGLLIQASGLPIDRFIAACNSNDTVPRFMENGRMETRTPVRTLSNAMDVAAPSNFERVLELFGHNLRKLQDAISAVSVTDGETETTIKRVYDESGYVLDPHGAVGYHALAKYLADRPEVDGIFLATAHPVKFDVVEELLGNYDVRPAVSLETAGTRHKLELEPDYSQLRDILVSKL